MTFKLTFVLQWLTNSLLSLTRMYALRRVRDAFKDNKTLTDSGVIKEQLEYGINNLEAIKRQVNEKFICFCEVMFLSSDSNSIFVIHFIHRLWLRIFTVQINWLLRNDLHYVKIQSVLLIL